MGFQKPVKKSVSRRQQRRFWTSLGKIEEARRRGEKKRHYLLPEGKTREAFAVSPTAAGIVREFEGRFGRWAYVRATRAFEKAVVAAKPKTFELQPVEFFGKKRNLLLERVYQAPSVIVFTGLAKTQPKKERALVRRIERKGYRWNEIRKNFTEDLKKMKAEIDRITQQIKEKTGRAFDTTDNNILLLDYNPAERKFLIAIVDILIDAGGSKNTGIREHDFKERALTTIDTEW